MNIKDIKTIVKEENKDIKMSYIGQIVERENIKFGKNNLILSPTGSGKTHFMESLVKSKFEKGQTKKSLLIIPTVTMKEFLTHKMGVEISDKKAEETLYGAGLYDIVTYAKVGYSSIFSNDFIEQYADIFCDEFHSLFAYFKMSDTPNGKMALASAIKALTESYEHRQIFYFTATAQRIVEFQEKTFKDVLRNVQTFDFYKYSDIKMNRQFKAQSYKHPDELPHLLRDYVDRIANGEVKLINFTNRINRQKEIEEILCTLNESHDKDPIKVLRVNSKKTKKEINKMSKETLAAREIVIKEGILPDPYTVYSFNKADEEGWDMKDERVQIAIIDSEDETEVIQSLGRVRHDIELLLILDRQKGPDFAIVEEILGLKLSKESLDLYLAQMGGFLTQDNKPAQLRGINSYMKPYGYKIEVEYKKVNTYTFVKI